MLCIFFKLSHKKCRYCLHGSTALAATASTALLAAPAPSASPASSAAPAFLSNRLVLQQINSFGEVYQVCHASKADAKRRQIVKHGGSRGRNHAGYSNLHEKNADAAKISDWMSQLRRISFIANNMRFAFGTEAKSCHEIMPKGATLRCVDLQKYFHLLSCAM